MARKDFLVIVIGSIFVAIILSRIFPNQISQAIISPLADSFSQAQNIMQAFKGKGLKAVVDKSLEGARGTYGVVIKNLATGESYLQNERNKFEAASLYKLWVLGTAYKQIKEGKLSRDEIISRDVKELNDIFKIGTDSAELTEGTVTMRRGDAIEQMITISNNYAALLLVSEIRNSNVSIFMREQGFSSSRLGEPPQTTAADIALFYEKLYQGIMVDGDSSREMLELLSHQKLNDRIPKYLPSNVEVAHKTGEIGDFKHDAGIIFGKDPILLVVLSESNSPQGATERIADLAKNVYYYFEGK